MTQITYPSFLMLGFAQAAEFFVSGKPAPAGSKTVGRKKDGSFFVRDASGNRGSEWKKRVREVAGAQNIGIVDGPLFLRLVFFVQRPKDHWNKTGLSAKGRRTPYPVGPPDTTKFVRSVEDALTGVLWRDDAQIVDQASSKVYCHTRSSPEGVYVVLGAYAKEERSGNQESWGAGDRGYAGGAPDDPAADIEGSAGLHADLGGAQAASQSVCEDRDLGESGGSGEREDSPLEESRSSSAW